MMQDAGEGNKLYRGSASIPLGNTMGGSSGNERLAGRRTHSRIFKATRCSESKPDKSYIGVRVRMPVRDILKNIRIAKGIDPKGTQGNLPSQGEKKRVNTSACRRNRQVEWENSFLKSITNQDLLVPDKNGKMMLHQFVEQGRRAPVYVIAKRMAGMEKLDVRDEEGKTALHLAAERNQHLMVSDLLCLGANVNKRDMYGKTCFHLSAENGYVRVLEVLDKFMKGGLHVDMEIKDCNGLTALQSASVALGSTGRAVEQTKDPSQTQLQTLRHHQMIETLECLLKMEGTMHHLVMSPADANSDSEKEKLISVPHGKIQPANWEPQGYARTPLHPK
ncbi:NF-kappa-B inhibitor zeta isoform X2 [Denticeps clupeoides]|uniref:NF-kappa-B inhibitor zeta isoform X2 n=1 Tax=Denticeps clupeoides TaxID=299321 RepID=UPI0010A53505|nr:NF-kappa-B inhibitor zeta-like isoform X2 [Denticeps clupeoides]